MPRHRTLPLISSLAIVLSICFLAAPVHGELPLARLKSIFPAGAKSGTSVEVTATGVDLDESSQLRFSHPGITAALRTDGAKNSQTERTFTVTVSSDVPVGIYELRTVGRFGVSNPRAFAVGDVPEVSAEQGKIGKAADALKVEFGSLVNGRCVPSSVDHYSIALRKGQRVLFRCETTTIDSRLEPMLEVLDPAGQEVARSRATGLLDFTAADEGNYVLRVHDVLYRGGSEYGYRVTVGTPPHVDFIFPPVGETGKKCKFDLYGRNLPGGTSAGRTASDGTPLEKLTVEIDVPAAAPAGGEVPTYLEPAAVTVDGFTWRFHGTSGTSNPVFIGLGHTEVTAEKEPNDDPASAPKLTAPFELAGEFFPNRDRDWVSFDAKKGEVWWVELVSDRRNLPTGPYVLLQRVKAGKDGEKAEDVKELAETVPADDPGGASFPTIGRDPAPYRLDVKEDATYRILVRDLFNGSQPVSGLVYRLSVRKAAPDFRVVSMPLPPLAEGNGRKNKNNNDKGNDPWTLLLRKGGVVPFRMLVFRQDGFDGEVQLTADGLPPGVTCEPVTVGVDADGATLFLKADENASAAAGSIRIVGKAKIANADVTHEARAGGVVWGTPPNANAKQMIDMPQSRLTGDLAVAVSGDESEPLSIAIGDGKPVEVAMGGKVNLPVKITRRGEFKDAIKLKAAGNAAMANAKEISLDGKTDSGAIEIDLSGQKLPPGTYEIYVKTQAQVKYVRPETEDDAGPGNDKEKKKEKGKKRDPKDAQIDFYSMPVVLKVMNPFTLSIDAAPLAVAAGKEAELAVKIERLAGFSEAVDIILKAPGGEKISAKKLSLAKDQSDGKLTITVNKGVSPGETKMTLIATTKVSGQDVRIEQPVVLKVEGN